MSEKGAWANTVPWWGGATKSLLTAATSQSLVSGTDGSQIYFVFLLCYFLFLGVCADSGRLTLSWIQKAGVPGLWSPNSANLFEFSARFLAENAKTMTNDFGT